MSLKTPQNLLIIGAVVAALLAGTILLGNYTNIMPCKFYTGSQAEASQVTGQSSCPAAKACPLGFDAKTCPLGRTEPCCAEEAEGCCPKKAEGCCPKGAEGCCPVKAESSCTVKAESSCTE